MAEDGRKMSKRRGNVVNPDDVIAEYGADAFRTYEMFMGPFDQSISRNTNGMKGVKKFLDKVVALRDKVSPPSEGGCSKGAEGSNILRNAKLSPNTQLRIN
ncbi:MAG: class I tRNA ligase family protein [Candidatus Peribacteria bacterium]|jgi:leucyl-tRNA synthetase|nr:class I tRNA ligase family protein [Candidatus Peribacteria bacterium]